MLEEEESSHFPPERFFALKFFPSLLNQELYKTETECSGRTGRRKTSERSQRC